MPIKSERLDKHLTRHPPTDGILLNYIDRGLYLIASKEIPRVVKGLNSQISQLRELEQILLKEFYETEKEKEED